MSTCTQSCDNFGYMFLNLVGEVGELASKVAKGIRKEEVLLFDNDLRYPRGIDGEIAKRKQAGTIIGDGDGIYNR